MPDITNYGDSPVVNLDQNQRDWYHPIIDRLFRQRSAFAGLVPFAFNMGALNAKNMTITQLIGSHGNFDALGLRDIWLPKSHVDSRNVTITFNHYGSAVAYDEFTDIVTYWKLDNKAGMSSLLQGELGHQILDINDSLIRNAYLSGPFKTYSGSATGFDNLATANGFELDIVREMWLGHAYRELPMASNPLLPQSNDGQLLCITTPGAIFDILGEEDWVARNQYAQPARILNYEVGSWNNCRFVQSPDMTLYNCGEIIARAPLDDAHTAGDGSPDPETTKVDEVYATGQKGVQHYLQLDTFTVGAITDIEVGDIVSIHTDVTSTFGVTNGADYRDGTKMDRRVMSVDAGNLRITLDRPIMLDMAGGTYVTKATHVHAALFIGAPGGVVGGVGRGIKLHNPPPIDDVEAVYRYSWNMFQGYNLYRPEVFDVYFFTAPVRFKGRKVTQAAS